MTEPASDVPFTLADRVRDVTTSTGTGAVTLAGTPPTGFRSFASALSTADTMIYCVAHQSADEWEVGIGTLSATTTLARTSVLSSSNAGALVSFTAGTKDVFITQAADGYLQLLSLVGATEPVPPAGTLTLFGRSIAGRIFPAFVGPSGLSTSVQPMLGRNRVTTAMPVAGTTSVSVTGIALTPTGTLTAAAPASTNLHTSLARGDYLITAASTTAVAGWRGSANGFWLGNAAGLGGFTFICRWSPATGVATATARHFVGMTNSTAAPTDVEPSSLTNMFGVGWDAADTNMQMMSNDASGTATKVDLGGSFPVPSADRPGVWELAMFSAPNSGAVNWTVSDVVSGATASGTITTDLPSNTTFLSPRGYMSVGGTSSVIGTTLFGLYLETDL